MPIRSRLAVFFLATIGAIGAHAQGKLVDVVEFYNASLDHYFISSLAGDIQALDSGKFAGWTRTGLGFKAYDAPAAGAHPVCRFYIPPAVGDSHFYSASSDECADVRAKFPGFSYESSAVMHVGLPDAVSGSCQSGWNPVYRLWNQRADSNHRYTTDRTVRDSMLSRGYVAEGYGPDGVAMCAADPSPGFELALTTSSLLLLPGETRDVYVNVAPRNGLTGLVTLTVSGLPPGVSFLFAPDTVTLQAGVASATLRFTVSASAAATAGPQAIVVSAQTSGGIVAQSALSLGVAVAGDPVAARLAAIAAVEEECRKLSRQGLSGTAFLQAVVTFMATRTEYKASGVDVETGSAWGRFHDGRLHMVVANREPAPGAPAGARFDGGVKNAELPQATKARLLHSFGRNFEGQGPVDEMRGYLRGKGWTVRSGAEGVADVGTLKGTIGDGFFYLNTHGGRAEVDDPSEPDGKMFSVQSSTLVDDNYEKVFAADLQALRLVHFTAKNGDSISILGFAVASDFDTRYAITYRFVDAYMSFSKESVVLMNACYSGRDSAFINAFLRKGAGVYLGWSELLSSDAAFKAAPYFVDRMVGANQHPDKESPPQRAFPYDLVLQDMAKKGLDFDARNGGRLQATRKTGLPQPPIFAPSIRYVQVDEYDETVTLTGYFSADVPKVTIGGIETTPKTWSPDKIVAKLPRTGAGASGDVIVEIRGAKSNARQLTEWSMPLKYLWNNAYDFAGHRFEGTGTVRFRADIGGHRLAPGEAPKYVVRGGGATQDSALPVTASGSHTEADCTKTLSGFGNFVSSTALQGAIGPPMLGISFSVDGETRKAAVGMAFGFLVSPFLMSFSGKGCPNPPISIAPAIGLLDGSFDLPFDQSDNPAMIPLPGFSFTLGSNYSMSAITKPYTDFGGTITVSWPVVAAKTPPRDTDDAGK